ncbi:hypothetical protein MMC31_002499, partial [Peltigera leucophlebia]|nr:hypothetical protein [Peltigera leucophlebia]
MAKDYTPKGEYITIEGLTASIFWFYDIFAFTPQTIQGADILGETYLVIIPDLFKGSFAQKDWYPPTNDTQRTNLTTFLTGPADRQKALSLVPEIIAGSAKTYPSIEKWAAIGFCWGGKIVAVTSDKGSKWVVSAQSSPAFVEVGDAAKIAIPHIVLASKDENKNDIKGYEERLEHVPHVVKTYDRSHGFQSARADLDEPESKKAYEEAYVEILNFFQEHF